MVQPQTGVRFLPRFVFAWITGVVLLAAMPAGAAEPRPLQSTLSQRARESGNRSARFVVIGDGGTGDAKQLAVAAAVTRVHAEAEFGGLLLLGDNVYQAGEVENFEPALGRPYRGLLDRGVRIYPILGNHDAETLRGEAMVRYLGMPGRWYSAPLAGGRVELFAIDTTLHVDDRWIYQSSRDALWRRQQAAAQLAWLDAALRSSRARYKLVLGHHPMYASGVYAHERAQVRAALEDMLVRNGVSAYFSGHQHIYERHAPRRGIEQFVSGGGGRDPHPVSGIADRPVVQAPKNHFMVFELKAGRLTYEARDTTGAVLDRGSVRPSYAARLGRR